MTRRNIDDQLRQYYGDVALAPASLDRLRGLLVQASPAEASHTVHERRSAATWQIVAIAASISIVFVAAAMLMLRKPGTTPPIVASSGLSERLAGEVARRHGRCVEEIDFRAEDLRSLLAQMQKVDFVAAVPSRGGLGTMKLKGAHYCVLDGQIAIHAVFVDDSGEIVSLFETRAGANMASLRAATHRLGRSDVELWQESGVLYATVARAPVT